MADRDEKDLLSSPNMNRRGLLKCMAWTGTGVVWTLSGGVPRTLGLIGGAAAAEGPQGALTFVQISDSHIGFHLPPNPDPSATLTEAINKIKAMPTQPAFLVHTGDISHLSKEEQWDDADQIIKSANKQVFFLPGEHDVADADNGKAYLARYGKNTKGKGWYSFDHGGVHFIGLINVFEFSTRLQIRRPFQARRRAAGMAGEGCQRALGQYADRADGPLAAVDDLRAVGLKNPGRRPRARLCEALRLGDRAQRPHPPDHPEGRGQRHVPYRGFDGISAACAGHRSRSGANEGGTGQ